MIYFLEIEAMKKQMQEEIRAQLMANQEAMSDMDWDSKVGIQCSGVYIYKIIITHKIPIMGRLSKDFKNRDGLDNLLINILN